MYFLLDHGVWFKKWFVTLVNVLVDTTAITLFFSFFHSLFFFFFFFMKLYQDYSSLSDRQTQFWWCILYGITFSNHSQNSDSACTANHACCHGKSTVAMLASYSILPRAILSIVLYISELLQSLVSVITEKLLIFFPAVIEISSCVHLHIFKFENVEVWYF